MKSRAGEWPPVQKIDLTNFQVATSETARAINRRIALNFLRRHQPMSRADLARRSGLQRSTVSSIVDQLIDEGWVTEGAIGRALRGRRPRYLHLNMERAGVLGVDLRPETTTVGLAGVDARFRVQTAWPTPDEPTEFVEELARTVTAFKNVHRQILLDGMGVCLPGRVDHTGRLVFAPNLGWEGINLAQLIERAIGLPVIVENAANACALAEFWFGHHPEHVRNLIAVTISEGIGVGLLLNGQLVHGAQAMAGEFGHMTIDEAGPACPCGKRGCWERYASNSSAMQQFLASPQAIPAPRFGDVLRVAALGDRHAIDVLERMAHFLGRGLAVLVSGLAPDLIVVIGEITSAWERVGPIVDAVVASQSVPGSTTRILPTDPITQPRLRGAVTLVVQQHFGAPAVG